MLLSGAVEGDRGGYQTVVQGALWSSLSKSRVFLALHALLLAPLLWCIGVAGLFGLNRLARPLPFLSALVLVAYYRLEPRYGPHDLPFLISVGGMACLGYLTVLLSVPGRTEVNGDGEPTSRPLRSLIFFAGFIASTVLVRIGAQRLAPGQLLSFGVLVPSTFWFASGALSAWTIHGEGSRLFELRERGGAEEAAPRRSRRRVVSLLAGFNLALWVMAAALLIRAGYGTPLWFASAPAVPAIMSVYSPWSWFFSEGSSFLFVPELGLTGEARGRLFLGILFEYLVIGTIWLTVRAIAHGRIGGRLLAAALVQLLYWTPTLWLFNLLGSMRQQ